MASEDKFVSVGLDVHERRKPPIKTHGSIRHGCDVDSATVRRPVASVTAMQTARHRTDFQSWLPTLKFLVVLCHCTNCIDVRNLPHKDDCG